MFKLLLDKNGEQPSVGDFAIEARKETNISSFLASENASSENAEKTAIHDTSAFSPLDTHPISVPVPVDTVAVSKIAPATIDLGPNYGQLINPVNVDGRWYYYWDLSGDGTSSNTQGEGYIKPALASQLGAVYGDALNHNMLDLLFDEDIHGNKEAGSLRSPDFRGTDDTYRYATLNGVRVALPTVGINPFDDEDAFPSTAVDNIPAGEINPAYNDLLAIWDASNGNGVGRTNISGVPAGWSNGEYWSASEKGTLHAAVDFRWGAVDAQMDYELCHVALEVIV